ncbi:CocE/NonD family hydrolase [Actinobacteria bacterium YIM 96077]|uniref:Peptidase S15 n=2 Tax=Phytoactinopolyspora halophila TaxID=1981511 RepID=A0A329QNB6_9ACTN|nr:CocE/NonD family hydrolase [Actinobacteria bacterium YIM 96077]RAW13847.1 peptidase S15 [Phytoactinopolyspora halophila]
MQIDWDVPIVVDDGLTLRADVFRPSTTDADARHPVLLSYGPYGKGLSFQEGYASSWEIMVREHPDVAAGSTNAYQNWEVVDPEKWVPHGYACVRVDSRGAGRSPGYLDPFSARETRDLYACIEWAGTQPWSTGKVGLAGISYYAINQWHVASLQPPHLACMVVWEGAADSYRDMSYHGGIYCTFFENWYDIQVTSVQYGRGAHGPVNPNTGQPVCGDETLSEDERARNRADFGAQLRAHPLADDFHRERSADWARITVPFLSAGNWGGQGLHLRGNVEGFIRAASTQKWLEVHGLEHWTEFYTDYGVNLQREFFDHFLKGVDNGWDRRPPVLLQVRTVDGFVERAESGWPLPRTAWTDLHLDVEDLALRTERPPRPASKSYDMLGPGLTLTTPPLSEPMEITGPLAARLFLASSTTDADAFLTVRAFAPDGSEMLFRGAIDPRAPLAQGWLRASHRQLDETLATPERPYHTHRDVQPLRPGRVYQLDVEIWPTSIVLPRGYRIALTVAGTDFDHGQQGARLGHFANEFRGCGPFIHQDPRDRPADVFGGTATLHTGGPYESRLLLPVIPDGDT